MNNLYPKELIEDVAIQRDQEKFKRHAEYIANSIDEIDYSLKELLNNPQWKDRYNIFVTGMVFDIHHVTFEESSRNLQILTDKILSYLKR